MDELSNFIERKVKLESIGKWASLDELRIFGVDLRSDNEKGIVAIRGGEEVPHGADVRTERINGVQMFSTSDLKHYGILAL